ncbi:MAG TPA: hypothetical protein VMV18_06920 [bacterium]|nr:hypothetical protein [bacterium]
MARAALLLHTWDSMILRGMHPREIGQILAALATLEESPPGAGTAEPVRGWQIELLADSLERALVTERDANEQEPRPAVRQALGDLTLALCAHIAEIRALAEVADALPASEQASIRALATRARLAFAAAVRERRRMQALRALRAIHDPAEPPPGAENLFAHRPRRVVCAGPDNAFRHLLAEQLRTQGFVAGEAADARGLLDRVARTFLRGRWCDPLDVLVVDARREGLTGLATIERVRAVDGAIPAVVLVPEGTEIAFEAARLGAAALVYAPHTVASIASAIREILAG